MPDAVAGLFAEFIEPMVHFILHDAALLTGLVWGVVVWAGMSFAVMPWLNPMMYAGTVRREPGWWFVLHLIYGGTLVVTPSVVRSVSAHRTAAEVTESWRAA